MVKGERRRKTVESELGKAIRKYAHAYHDTGQVERAEGMFQAADMVDGARMSDIFRILKGQDASALSLEQRVAALEQAISSGPASPANGKAVSYRPGKLPHLIDDVPSVPIIRPSKPKVPDPHGLGPAARAMLQVLVQHPNGLNRTALAIMSHYSRKSGSFHQALAQLRAAAFVSGNRQRLAATEAGKSAAGPVESLPTGEKLIDYWSGRLSPCASTFLEIFVTAAPEPVERGDLAQRSGYRPTSGSFHSALAELRALGLVDGYRASDSLIEALARKG